MDIVNTVMPNTGNKAVHGIVYFGMMKVGVVMSDPNSGIEKKTLAVALNVFALYHEQRRTTPSYSISDRRLCE